MTNLSFPAKRARGSQSCLRDDLTQAHAEAQKLRHHQWQRETKRIAHAVSVEVGADRIGVKVVLESLLRAVPGEAAAAVSDIEPNAPFPGHLHLRNQR